jgi:glycosyltransferase involved in cell wall biosynthesis
MATFTIGIPTFNRAHWLPDAIACALGQTRTDIEIIVSDNASTDSTADVVRRFGDRVRYVRNDANLGAWRNLSQLVEMASGEYFSWLQDDDCIFAGFVERAAKCLDGFPRATAYGAYAIVASNMNCLAKGWMYGPPLALDWIKASPRAVPGDLITPLSLCVSVAIPPVVAFRTAALRECISRCNHAIPLYMERTLLADVASLGEIVFDPFVAGIFRAHANQGFRVIQANDPEANKQQWLQMARELDALPLRRGWQWRERLVSALTEIGGQQHHNWELESRDWPTDIRLCQEMRDALLAKPPPTRVPLSPSGIAKAGVRAARSLLSRVMD